MKVIARRAWAGTHLEHPAEFELELEDGTPLGGSVPRAGQPLVPIDNDILDSCEWLPADTEVEVLIRSILDEIPLVCDMEVEWR